MDKRDVFEKDARFDIFTAVMLNIPAFWNVRSHPLLIVTDASEELAASTFKVQQIYDKGTLSSFETMVTNHQ
jgi:hypothetical protein